MNFIQAFKLLTLNQTKEISSKSTNAIYFKNMNGELLCKFENYGHILATDWKLGPSWKPESCYNCKENSTLVLINDELI